MSKPRGSEHTTLTETAQEVVDVLSRIEGVKMIAPGIITRSARGKGGLRFITIVHTQAGFELIISGQGVQKVAVHTLKTHTRDILATLKNHKRLTHFSFKERDRKPGI